MPNIVHLSEIKPAETLRYGELMVKELLRLSEIVILQD